MKLRYLATYILLCLALAVNAQPTDVTLKTLTTYTLSNHVTLENGVNFMVISKEKMFNKTFGVVKPADGVNYPDFEKEIALVLAMEPTTKETKLEFKHIIKAGDFIEVYYDEHKSYPLTYTIQPLAIAVVPKYKGVNTVKFYEGKRLVKTLKIQ